VVHRVRQGEARRDTSRTNVLACPQTLRASQHPLLTGWRLFENRSVSRQISTTCRPLLIGRDPSEPEFLWLIGSKQTRMYAAESQTRLADELLSPSEVAEELRCSKAHVYKIIHGNVAGVSCLPAINLGRRKLVRRSCFEQWKRSNETATTSPGCTE